MVNEVGRTLGDEVDGTDVGVDDGATDGMTEGVVLGIAEGCIVGKSEQLPCGHAAKYQKCVT